MNWKDSYNDICAELRIVQLHEMEMRRRVEKAHTVMFSGEMPSSGSYCHLPLDKAIEHFNTAVVDLNEIQGEVDRLQGIKIQMEDTMGIFTGLRNRIVYERTVNGKKYKEIADEMGYSVGHLRATISRKRNKDATHSTNVS